jgi:apolipoprotein D and lipocalin family protein
MTLKQMGFLFGALSAAFSETPSSLQTVPTLDLNRYAGKWYEIARYPNRFEKKCSSDITAQYSLLPDGKIKVVNSCRQADGKQRVSTGMAKVVDKRSNAKLKVTFFWPFYGNYWVIDLDPEYRYAVVSEPRRKYLWILSRTPEMEPDSFHHIMTRLRAMEFDPSKLIRVIQPQ